MDKGRDCNSSNCSAGSANKRTIEVIDVKSSEKRVNAEKPKSISGNTTKAKVGPVYEGTSYCKNKGKYEDKERCIADIKDCKYYVIMQRKSDGIYLGVCQKRHDAKLAKNRQQISDIKKIQDISTYNGRRL